MQPRERVADKEELSPREEDFLKFVSQHSDMFVTEIYQALGLSGYKGDRVKRALIEQGLIAQEETRKGRRGRLAKVLTLTDKGADIVKNLPLKGKGGDAHQQTQEMIKNQAEVFGWTAAIEKKISRGGLESVSRR